MPFGFEMTRRANNAAAGVRKLQPYAHTLITVPNDRLLQIVPKDLTLEIAFRLADDVLRQGVQGVAELVTRPGLINVDFAHVRELLMRGGGALMAIGLGQGDQKARQAIQQALRHPLLQIENLDDASGVLLHFSGGQDLTLYEIGESVTELRASLSPDADLILGATTESDMVGRAQAIVIVTGIGGRPVAGLHAAPSQQHQQHSIPHLEESEVDLPTFLRRRVEIGG
jgi:cell division protein FtsZ